MNIYKSLIPFTNFNEFLEENHYTNVPRDWYVILTDIQGSTQTIEKGQYKLVNMVGASTIAAVSNVLQSLEFPLVFGGDGATILLPSEYLEQAKKFLRSVQKNCLAEFNLNLRIGIVPMFDVYKNNKNIRIAKFILSGGPTLAFLKGDGVDWVESVVKNNQYQLEDGPAAEINTVLNGLSCRWAPLKSTQGCILSLLIKERSQNTQASVLKTIVNKIDSIVDLSSEKTNPIKSHQMRLGNYQFESELEEKLTHTASAFKIKIKMLTSKIMRLFNLSMEGVTFKQYLNANPTHSDFKKFDGMIRMVIDCSQSQKQQVLDYLEQQYKDGHVYYGYAISNSALITCFVREMGHGQHIHFVDGNDGGYTLAAKMLKKQILVLKK